MYTALQSFEPVFKANPGMKLILLPDIQETSDVACDTGSDPSALRKEIDEKGLPVDASLVHEGWNVKVRFDIERFLGKVTDLRIDWSLRTHQCCSWSTCTRRTTLAKSPTGEGNRHGLARRCLALLY
jgi:hypothetical protein